MTSFSKIAILGGGGLMGHGIALACLQGSDAAVTIVSRHQESVDHGISLIETGPFGLAKGVKRGKLTQTDADAILGRLSGSTDYAEGLAGADLVFETIPESVAIKHEALVAAERHAPNAVFATNTSSIMISELAAPMADPGRLVGTHWFYPSNVMPLVEVACGELTNRDNLDNVVNYLSHIGKKPVVVGDAPGFFMTRFINNYIAEAIRLVELGVAGPAEIDEMCKTGLGWPMGVFELLDDAAAFDSYYQAQTYLHETCGERYAIPPLARKVFLAGYKGNPKLKPGSRGGFYDFLGIKRPEKARQSS
ncbi:MAG: 3-hydroxyacyl-CoA dehydrogenase NAD-binding domain-containing protein [Alphaproteobacteria bacterium]|nr:3-hydroxyacyl-CoA dehydrogenase NAD-binding domain-containing protein [Alphaproteobacteria bacterium]